ncbi:MAG: DUF6327 family protein [Flavobacterium sp.]
MEKKKYSSYAQIENDLEILKVEKEIHYQRMLLSIEKTKESILPSKTVSFVETIYDSVFSGSIGTILKIAIPYIVNWYINRKRGD